MTDSYHDYIHVRFPWTTTVQRHKPGGKAHNQKAHGRGKGGGTALGFGEGDIKAAMESPAMSWLMDKASKSQPYASEGADYTEYSFSGRLPGQMANNLKSQPKKHRANSDGDYAIREKEKRGDKTIARSVDVRFGSRRSNQNNVTFMYTEETE